MTSSSIPEGKSLELVCKTSNVPQMEERAWALALHSRPCLLLPVKGITAVICPVNFMSTKILLSNTHEVNTISITILQMATLRLVEPGKPTPKQ